MFLSHFKLDEHPFCENPPLDWLLNDDRFRRALAQLKLFRSQADIALVTGQTGVGKTSLVSLFKQNMPKNRYRPVYLHLSGMSQTAFLRLIVAQLGESPRLGKDRLFLQIIDRIGKSEAKTVLIFDEAHLISPQSLTDLRLLVCSKTANGSGVKVVLSGQDALLETLKRSILGDLNNRIWIRCRLHPLSKTQTLAYMDHRLRLAGGSEKIFTADAGEIIHDYSGGVPRQINNIATACLIGAAATGINQIDADFVNETMANFSLS
ncbi:MAG: AAA family ATPase [Gammaproteobacteria bacterium]|nr:AAA family ATPase [Gammaproteobacteria bacterium]